MKEKKESKTTVFRFPRIKILLIAVALTAAVTAALILLPRLKSRFTMSGGDTSLGGSSVVASADIAEAVLGEMRTQSSLVALERDASVDTTVSTALLDWDVFRKTKTIRCYGTGVYTVELGGFTDDDITVDDALRIVTVSIPHAELAYVTVDLEKTEFEETQHGFLSFGELKLTPEQQNALERETEASLRDKLNDGATLNEADAAARKALEQLLTPIVSAADDAWLVKVVTR